MRGAVAVKFSNPQEHARDMLLNEAKIYNAFPRDLQGGDLPIVPKFYGCYMPYVKLLDGNGSANLDKKEWTRDSMPKSMSVPILLLEACGEAVRSPLDYSRRWESNHHNISLHHERERTDSRCLF